MHQIRKLASWIFALAIVIKISRRKTRKETFHSFPGIYRSKNRKEGARSRHRGEDKRTSTDPKIISHRENSLLSSPLFPSAPYVTISHPEQSISLLPSPLSPSLPSVILSDGASLARNTPLGGEGRGARSAGKYLIGGQRKRRSVDSLIIQNASSIVGSKRRRARSV